ncbi:RHS repeat-associated core domain-containing protein [Undibacterium sp. LX15W]|uniref:RHS repeat-associated core domain-containing protein n=1 Tax=Undibacterium flavidum TaxID=2762297 RepID=A0ABR6YHZ6_9BURK|nr:RHS repeat-associated core domain-containing protein [Undibacterium flavidum]
MWSKSDGSQALHHDALGSITATTDTSGQLKSETVYDAFGNIVSQSGQSANKFGYTGHQMDQETGLIYFQARYYDPQTGRFITQDPYEGDWNTPLSLHHYLYAYGNPTTYVDLHGYANSIAGYFEQKRRETQEANGQVVGAVVGGVVGIGKAIYATGKFVVYDAIPAMAGNENAKARMDENGKAVATLLLQPQVVWAAMKQQVAQADVEAAQKEQNGNYSGAAFSRAYARFEIAAPIVAGIASGRVPTLSKALGVSGERINFPINRAVENAPPLPKSEVVVPEIVTTAEPVSRPGTTIAKPARDAAPKNQSVEPDVSDVRFTRIDRKSVRSTDYPTRERKATTKRLEEGATGSDGVIRCQGQNCKVQGGRELAPGEGTPQHIPSLVDTHNRIGYDTNQRIRNDLYNETAKELHCLDCQHGEGGSTTARYRRDVGPNYEARQSRQKTKKREEKSNE